VTEPQQPARFVHVLALGIAPEWRRRPDDERRADLDAFCAAERSAGEGGVGSLFFTSIGLEPGVDIVLWRTSEAVDALERAAARLLATGLGRWTEVRQSFLGRTGPSQYVVKPTSQDHGLTGDDAMRYLVVYPFTKSTDWYLTPREMRQAVMNEHMKVGRRFPMVRQALAYSFGLDDQDFIVAYETDDLPAFGDLVRELRATEARRSTASDTPILTAVHRPVREILELLGGGTVREPVGASR
jgi:chlorite dismutase